MWVKISGCAALSASINSQQLLTIITKSFGVRCCVVVLFQVLYLYIVVFVFDRRKWIRELEWNSSTSRENILLHLRV